MNLEIKKEKPDDDLALFVPLEVEYIKSKRDSKLNLSEFVGPVSETKRTDDNADIILQFTDQSFKAHQDVLRNASEYFEKEFRSPPAAVWVPKRAKVARTFGLSAANILPSDCTAATLDRVIDFAYTGFLPILPDHEGMQKFFAVAVALHFKKALEIYRLYFKTLKRHKHRVLTNDDAAGILSALAIKNPLPARFCDCSWLIKDVLDDLVEYIVKESLDKLIDDREFWAHLSPDGVLLFLSRDDIAGREQETKVLDLALTWMKYDKKRQQYAKQLLEKIHLGVLSESRLTSLISEIETIPGCKEIIEEVLQLMKTKDDVYIPLDYSNPQWFAARNEMLCTTIIGKGPLAQFGRGQCLLYFNAYGPGPKKRQGWQDWCDFTRIPDPPCILWDYSLLELNGKLIQAGGCDNTHRKRSKYVDSFAQACSGRSNVGHVYEGDIGSKRHAIEVDDEGATLKITNPWCMLPGMEALRRNFPMVHLDGYLYLIGGEEGEEDNTATKWVERYNLNDRDPKRYGFDIIAELPIACYYASAVAYKGKILVYGSQPVPDSDTPAQHNLMMYDPLTDKWENLLEEFHHILKYMRTDHVRSAERNEDMEDSDVDDKDDRDGKKTDDEPNGMDVDGKDGSMGADEEQDCTKEPYGMRMDEKDTSIGADKEQDGTMEPNGMDVDEEDSSMDADEEQDDTKEPDGMHVDEKDGSIDVEHDTTDVSNKNTRRDCDSEKKDNGNGTDAENENDADVDNTGDGSDYVKKANGTAVGKTANGADSAEKESDISAEKTANDINPRSAKKENDRDAVNNEGNDTDMKDDQDTHSKKEEDGTYTDIKDKEVGGTDVSKEENDTEISKKEGDTSKDAAEDEVEDEDEEEYIDPWFDYNRADASEEKKEVGPLLPRNALVVDGDDCFRVVYTAVESEESKSKEQVGPLVHKLEFDFASSPPSVKLGEAVDQSLLPTTGEGAFQINKKVYVNMRGAVHETRIKIVPGQVEQVDLGVWKRLLEEIKDLPYEDMTFTNFTFDKKKLFCSRCLSGKSCLNSWAEDSDDSETNSLLDAMDGDPGDDDDDDSGSSDGDADADNDADAEAA